MDMTRSVCFHIVVDILHWGVHAEVFAISISVNSKLSELNLTCMMVIGLDRKKC